MLGHLYKKITYRLRTATLVKEIQSGYLGLTSRFLNCLYIRADYLCPEMIKKN
jgi:hypothetical protein